MKKTLQLLLALFAFTYASAQDFSVGDLSYTIIGTDVEVEGFSGAAVANITVPATVENGGTTYNVIAIGNSAFSKLDDVANDGIETVSLPSSVVTIGDNAFDTQRNLTTINLENVVTIGIASFAVCDNMTNVDLSSAVTLGNYCFNRCHAFTGEFETPVAETIGTGSIYNSNVGVGIQSYNIPSSVTSIGALFLGRITTLTAVQVNWTDPADASVTAKNFFRDLDIDGGAVTLYVPVGTKALYEAAEPWGANSTTVGQYFNHANIVEGNIPSNIVGDTFSDGDYNFKITSLNPNEVAVSGTSNAALTDLVIAATATDGDNVEYSVTSVAANAFDNNDNVVTVSLASSIKDLGLRCFRLMDNLTTINLDNVVTFSAKDAFSTCGSLTNIGTLSNATTIADYTFYKCTSLTSVEIPAATSIGNGAFRQSGITSINIPSTVTSLGNQLFKDATSLTSIQLNWADPATGVFGDTSDTFGGLTESNITIYVPTGTVSAYEAASPWNEITNITDATLSAADIVNNSLNIQVSAEALTITSSSTFTNGSLSIYDITGRVLSSTSLNSASASVNISNLASGVYIVKVTEGNAKLVKRFVKQ